MIKLKHSKFFYSLLMIGLIFSCSTEEDVLPTVTNVQSDDPDPDPDPVQYTLAVSAGEGGSVSTEGGLYDEGTSITVTANPDEGYEFVGWEGSDATETELTISINYSTNTENF